MNMNIFAEDNILYTLKYEIIDNIILHMEYYSNENIIIADRCQRGKNFSYYKININDKYAGLMMSLVNKNINKFLRNFYENPVVYSENSCLKNNDGTYNVLLNQKYKLIIDNDSTFYYYPERSFGYTFKNNEVLEEYDFLDAFYSINRKNNNTIIADPNGKYNIECKLFIGVNENGCIITDKRPTLCNIQTDNNTFYDIRYNKGIINSIKENGKYELCHYSRGYNNIISEHPLLFDYFNPKYSDPYLNIWAHDEYEFIDGKQIISRIVFNKK